MFLLILAFFFPLGLIHASPLVVCYATTHLNQVENAVAGVLITPSGDVLKTRSLNPFDQENLVIESPEEGTYRAYFESLYTGPMRLCHFVGGISALQLDHPAAPVPFSPTESHIHTFPSGQLVQAGSYSQPIATFQITTE